MSACIWECEYHVITHTCVITRVYSHMCVCVCVCVCVCEKFSHFKCPTLDACILCAQLLSCGCQQVRDVGACHTLDGVGYPIGWLSVALEHE